MSAYLFTGDHHANIWQLPGGEILGGDRFLAGSSLAVCYYQFSLILATSVQGIGAVRDAV